MGASDWPKTILLYVYGASSISMLLNDTRLGGVVDNSMAVYEIVRFALILMMKYSDY